MNHRMYAFAFLLLGIALQAAPSDDFATQKWHGPAICYSGYREGQNPDLHRYPTPDQVAEDLRLLDRNWSYIRVYGADQHSEDVLTTIRKYKLHLRVLLGLWLNGKPEKDAENEAQIKKGIELAKTFPEIVAAVNVGNEALVSWSDHRMDESRMIDYVKRVKAAIPCRITVADDFLYWSQPNNRLVPYLDFITLHTYPIWGREDIDVAMATTVRNFETIRKAYPNKPIVFGEVGWASYTEGDKHVPRAGDEVKQQRYFEEVNAWAKTNGVTTFYFEAFDEPWKGAGTEGHWGVFTVKRQAKPVVRKLYPELKPTGPTSPGYECVRTEVAP